MKSQFLLIVTASLVFLTLVSGGFFFLQSKLSFTKPRIDIGIVVKNSDNSVKFYKEALGFIELQPFNVSAEFSTKAGLTDGKPLNVRVLSIGKGKNLTHLKLMQISDTKTLESQNSFIHSQFGFRYLTLFVVDLNKVLQRVSLFRPKVLVRPAVRIEAEQNNTYLALIADPDGNIIELIGVKR